MPGPHLPKARRDEIAAAIAREPVPSTADLANEFDVSRSTIYRIAADYDLADAWEHRREKVEAANAANAVNLAARRQQLEAESIDAAREFLQKRNNQRQVAIKGLDGADIVVLDASAEDYRNTGSAVASVVNAAVQLARLESELSGAGHAGGLLSEFKQAITEAEDDKEKLSRIGELER